MVPTSTSTSASRLDPPPGRERSAVRAGAEAMLPLVAGYVPFAFIIGTVVAAHGSAVAGWSGSWLIFGGSAHLATIRTLDRSGAALAILTGLLINARLVVYSAGLARRWSGQPRWFRIAAAGLIIDPTWAEADRHAATCTDPAEQRRFFLAAGLTLGVGWSAAIAAGALVGPPPSWLDLDIVIPLCLLRLVGPGLRVGRTRTVTLVAATAAVLAVNAPNGTGLLLAIVAGTAAGMLADRRAQS